MNRKNNNMQITLRLEVKNNYNLSMLCGKIKYLNEISYMTPTRLIL